MDQNLIANSLSLTLFVVSLFIALRAFYLYVQSHSHRLFILGLSMSVIALTAAAGFLGDNLTSITLNVDWFNYIGQTVSFLFILLSFVRSSDDYLRRLISWQIIASILLMLLLLMAPILPAEFPDPAVTKSLLSGSRGLICFMIFFYYVSSFMTRETLFSLLMSAAFLLLSFGYFTIVPKYFYPNDTLDHVGDIMRICGLLALLIVVLAPNVSFAQNREKRRKEVREQTRLTSFQ
ncbi:MAG: hypothetical protein E6I91_01525 [Chloroflexi bacterium]|nr:MAG: hypothetical protein E6I91_01525 [Chloroflexota bacterium]